jgi:hypothetical protein
MFVGKLQQSANVDKASAGKQATSDHQEKVGSLSLREFESG